MFVYQSVWLKIWYIPMGMDQNWPPQYLNVVPQVFNFDPYPNGIWIAMVRSAHKPPERGASMFSGSAVNSTRNMHRLYTASGFCPLEYI